MGEYLNTKEAIQRRAFAQQRHAILAGLRVYKRRENCDLNLIWVIPALLSWCVHAETKKSNIWNN